MAPKLLSDLSALIPQTSAWAKSAREFVRPQSSISALLRD